MRAPPSGVVQALAQASLGDLLFAQSGFWTGRRFVILFLPNLHVGVGAIYDPCTDTWTPADFSSAPAGFTNIASLQPTIAKDAVILLPTDTSTTALSFDTIANRWSSVPIQPPGPTDPNGSLVMPGLTEPQGVALGDGQSFVLGSTGLVPVPPIPSADTFPATFGALRARVGTHLVAWGGAVVDAQGNVDRSQYPDEVLTNAGWIFDVSAGSWRATTNVGAPSPRDDPAALVVGPRLLVFGGSTHTQFGGGTLMMASDGAWLDIGTGAWTSAPGLGAPASYAGRMAWTGRDVVLTGGAGTPTAGAALVGGTNLWRPLPDTDASSVYLNVLPRSSVGGRVVYSSPFYSLAFVLEPQETSWRTIDLSTGPLGGRNQPWMFWTGRRLFYWSGSKPTATTPPPCNAPMGFGCDPGQTVEYLSDGASVGIDP
jgi:hypothetical protein